VDGDRFEFLLRALTMTPTRRGVAHFLCGLGFAGLVRPDEADAKRKRRKKKGKKKSRNKMFTQPPPSPEPVSSPPAADEPPPAPEPPLPPCVGTCTGKTCGDDGCGVSCGACAGGSVCAGGQCVAACCAEGTSCLEEYCTCATGGGDFCSCPAGDVICNGAGCCLAGDACIAPIDVFDGERRTCFTQTCHAGNDVCQNEFAFCGSGPPGSCGCVTHSDGSPLCAVMPPPDEHYCPEFNECDEDGDCPADHVCANVDCCNSGVEPFVGRCVTPCS
jgi:hypothetical protein